jgi:hypothetical protein
MVWAPPNLDKRLAPPRGVLVAVALIFFGSQTVEAIVSAIARLEAIEDRFEHACHFIRRGFVGFRPSMSRDLKPRTAIARSKTRLQLCKNVFCITKIKLVMPARIGRAGSDYPTEGPTRKSPWCCLHPPTLTWRRSSRD